MTPTMSKAIDLAKECGFPEWWINPPEPERKNGEARKMLETFYRRAQAEELEACLLLVQSEALSMETDSDTDRAYNAAIFDAASAIISRKRRMAKELDAG